MRRARLLAPSTLALLLALAGTPGRSLAAWPLGSTPGLPVCTAPMQQQPPALAPDSCGGAIFTWEDARLPGQDLVYVQRVDAYGQPRWPLDGIRVCSSDSSQDMPDVCSDANGGAFVAWVEQRTAASEYDVFLQHVLATGVLDPAWPADGVPACMRPYRQAQPRIVADGLGGGIVAWTDYRDGNVDIGSDIQAQRIDAAGNLLWGPNGVTLTGGPGHQNWFDIAGDGAGGVVAAWQDGRTGNGDIVAQRLDTAGAEAWNPGGVVLATTPQVFAFLRGIRVSFHDGRTFVTWIDSGPGASSQLDMFAQAIAPGGALLWGPAGVWLNNGFDSGYYVVAEPDGLDGLIVAWMYRTLAGNRMAIQRLNPSGSPLWAPGGVELSGPSGVPTAYAMTSDARNGAIVVWDDERNGGGSNTDLYAQRVTDAGVPIGTAGGVPLATSGGRQSVEVLFSGPRERLVPDGAGGAVAGWFDTRVIQTNGADVYAHQIGATGAVGVRAPSVDCMPDICGHAYDDFGDAPENLPGFPSGSLGHYPTCKTATMAGTQEVDCGAAPGTPPGPTGYVEHVGTNGDPNYVTFGCRNAPPVIGVDSEVDGLVNVGSGPPPLMPATSACNPAAALQNYEDAFGGLWFGGDDLASPAWGVALASRPSFRNCATASLRLRTGACGPQNTNAYLNVLVDWNLDGDWNDVARCGAAGAETCAPEWAVKNAQVSVRPGCDSLDTPVFQVGPATGGTWMRLTLTLAPVTDDFPWAGSAVNPGPGGATGSFAGGETEDYPVSVVPALDAGDPPTATTLALSPISPNPTRGAAEVRFTLPATADVRLGVYDLAGRRVRELAAGWIAAGSHAARWDGRDGSGDAVGSGLYFVRLEAAGRSVMRTLVRMK